MTRFGTAARIATYAACFIGALASTAQATPADAWDPTDDVVSGATYLEISSTFYVETADHNLWGGGSGGGGDVDWYDVYLSEGVTYTFGAATSAPPSVYCSVYLYAQAGATYITGGAWNWSNGQGRLDYTITKTGHYNVRVEEPSWFTGVYAYRLKYRHHINTPPVAFLPIQDAAPRQCIPFSQTIYGYDADEDDRVYAEVRWKSDTSDNNYGYTFDQ